MVNEEKSYFLTISKLLPIRPEIITPIFAPVGY